MKTIKLNTPLSPAEVTRLLRAGGTYSAHTVAHPTGMGWEIGLPDGYELRSLSVATLRSGGQPNRLQRGRTSFAPKSASNVSTARSAAPSSGGSYFGKRLSPVIERTIADMEHHELTAGGAVIQILRALVIETGDSSSWEHCHDEVKSLVDKLYLEHRKSCPNICQVGDPEISPREFEWMLTELNHQMTRQILN